MKYMWVMGLLLLAAPLMVQEGEETLFGPEGKIENGGFAAPVVIFTKVNGKPPGTAYELPLLGICYFADGHVLGTFLHEPLVFQTPISRSHSTLSVIDLDSAISPC